MFNFTLATTALFRANSIRQLYTFSPVSALLELAQGKCFPLTAVGRKGNGLVVQNNLDLSHDLRREERENFQGKEVLADLLGARSSKDDGPIFK